MTAQARIRAAELAHTDEGYMRRAIALARRGVGRTSPNPAVGALVVMAGRVVASGWHKRAGLAHAEAAALSAAPRNLRAATLYVTLEPCSHHGRTPPCVDAVISSGVGRVVTGMRDPNPLVRGRGIRKLRAAGVEVVTGVLEDECRALNAAYVKYMTMGLPFVTVKLASTLDGRIATASGESRWITGLPARRLVHRMRASVDAVVTGAGTVAQDDPALTVRHVKGRKPLRVVLDTAFATPLSAKVFRGGPGLRPAIVFTTRAAPGKKLEAARSAGVEAVLVGKGRNGVDLERVLHELASREITSVLVEGGGVLAASFIRAGLADRFSIFVSPMLIGSGGVPSIGDLGVKGLSDAARLEGVSIKRVGADVLIEGRVKPARAGRPRK